MPYNDSSKRATIKYIKENLEDVRFRVPKGKREMIRAYAIKNGHESLSAYIKKLISADMGGIDL